MLHLIKISFCLCLLFISKHYAQAQAHLAIQNVSVVDVINLTTAERTVLIRDGKIFSIEARNTRVPKGYQRVDGSGKFLIPGLINCYTHIHEFNTSLYLAHGITTVRDAPSMGHLPGLAEAISKGKITGPEIYLTGNALSGTPTAFPTQHPLRTEHDARLAVRDSKRMGYNAVFIYGSMSPEVYPYVLDEAKNLNIDVTGHFPSRVVLKDIQQGQQRSYDNLSGLLRNGAWRYDTAFVDGLLSEMKSSGRYLVPTLTVHKARANGPQTEQLIKQERMNYVSKLTRAEWSDLTNSAFIRSGYNYAGAKKFVQQAHKMGVSILPGSDGGFPLVVDGFAYIDELRNLRDAGMDNGEIVQSATIKAAEFMRWDKRIGSIAPGKEADLILLNANPLTDIENIARIDAVIVNGKLFTHDELWKQANEQRDRMNDQLADMKPASVQLTISKSGVKSGAESIQCDTLDKRVHISNHNFIEGPYTRSTKSDFWLTGDRIDSMSVTQNRVDGDFRVAVVKRRDSIIIAGSAPYFGSFRYSIAGEYMLLAPMQSWHFSADVWVNYYLLAKRNFSINPGTTKSVVALQVELNSEEFGERFIYDTGIYRVTKLEGDNPDEVRFLITQPSAQGEEFISSNNGSITVVAIFDKRGNVKRMEASTVNGKVIAESK